MCLTNCTDFVEVFSLSILSHVIILIWSSRIPSQVILAGCRNHCKKLWQNSNKNSVAESHYMLIRLPAEKHALDFRFRGSKCLTELFPLTSSNLGLRLSIPKLQVQKHRSDSELSDVAAVDRGTLMPPSVTGWSREEPVVEILTHSSCVVWLLPRS